MVRPEQVLKELAKLWVDLGHEEAATPGETHQGVLRACAMTLITIADEAEDPTNIGETIALLMKEHPSRSVMIRLRPGNCLESRVYAQCWMPFGQHRQICCEQIEITAGLSNLDDVTGVVLPLTVPDLPVILWIRSPRLIGTPAFPRIAAMSNKVVMDTGAFPGGEGDAREALDLLCKTKTKLCADLAWSRITRWRETVSQIFVNDECLLALPKVTEASVEYGSEKPRTEARYLAAWLQNGLAHAGSDVKVGLIRGEGPAVAAVRMRGPACNVAVQCDASGSVETRVNDLVNKTIFSEATDYLALQEELSITTRDAVFDAALQTALEMAQTA